MLVDVLQTNGRLAHQFAGIGHRQGTETLNQPAKVEALDEFREDVEKLLPQMRAALEKGDLAGVGHLGHRMKGTVAYLGAEPAREAALRVERFCKDGGTASEAEEAVNRLLGECEVLKAALQEHPLPADPPLNFRPRP